ncbi:MAG TPA: hypothetical protein EYN67_00025 [Flavobacteriales bacterium]|nr:hypothetical protein [Flavobacteriales bacterium]
MSHTVSGLIRRSPHIQAGQNNNGTYTMFCFELSEFNKGTQGAEDSYTNYSVALFAKTQGAIEFHQKAIAEGSFVVVTCDKLLIDKQSSNDGKEYIKLKMMNASLSDFNNPNQQQAPQQQPAYNQGQQQGGFSQQAPQQQHQGQQQGGFTQQSQDPRYNQQ